MPTPTISWIVDTDGDWSTIADWSPHRVPGSADDVAIDTAHFHTITHNTGSNSVHSLAVGNDDFVVSGGSLTITGSASFANSLTVSGGTLNLTSANATASDFTQISSNLVGSGTLTVTGPATFSSTKSDVFEAGPGKTLLKGSSSLGNTAMDFGDGRILENQGTFTVDGGTFSLGYDPITKAADAGGKIENDAQGVFDLTAPTDITGVAGSVAFINAGLLEQTVTTGPSDISAPLSNTGTVSVQTGTLEIDRAFTDSGSGVLSVAKGATLLLDGGGSAPASAFTIASGGTVDFNNGVFTLGAGAVGGAGTAEVTGGELALGANAVTLAAFTQISSILVGGGTLTVTGSATFSSTTFDVFEAGAGTTLLKGSSSLGNTVFDLGGGRILENQGTFTVDGGTFSLGYDPITKAAYAGGKIENDAQGLFDLTAPTDITGVAGSVAFINAGLLEQTASTGTSDISAPLINTGTVSVQTGTLEIDGVFTDKGSAAGAPLGTIFVASGATLVLADGGSIAASDITVESGGTLDFAGGVFSLGSGTIIGEGTVELTGGELALGANAVTVAAFSQGSSVLVGSGTLTVNGPAMFSSTTLAAFEAGAGTTLLKGPSFLGNTVFDLGGNRILDNQGTFTVEGGIFSLGYDPITKTAYAGGKIENDAQGVFDLTAPTDITGIAGSVAFINAGLLEQTVTTGTSVITAPFANTGTVSVQSGTLEIDGVLTETVSPNGAAGTLLVGSGAVLDLAGGGSVPAGNLTTDSGGTLDFGGGVFTLGAGTINGVGAVEITAGVLKVSGFFDGSLTANGPAPTVTGGVLELLGGGSVNASGFSVSGGGTVDFAGGLFSLGPGVIDGDVEVTAGRLDIGVAGAAGGPSSDLGVVYPSPAGSGTTVQVNGEFDESGGAPVVVGPNATLNLLGGGSGAAGAFQLGSGATLDFGAGTFALGAGKQAGAVEVTGGEVDLTGSVEFDGAFTQAAGTTVALGANTLTLTGASTLEGTISGAGGLACDGGTDLLNKFTALPLHNWVISNGAVVSLAGNVTYASSFTENGSATALGGFELTLTGAASFTSATINGGGYLITKGSTTAAGITLGGAARWLNYGTVDQTALTTMGDGVAGVVEINNEVGAVFDFTTDTGIGVAGSSGVLFNGGLLEKTAGTGVSSIAAAVSNGGVIEVSGGGTLQFQAAVSGAGSATITGGTLRFGSTFTQNVSFTGGTGELDLARSQSYTGTVSGFSASGGTEFDLEDIAFVSAGEAHFSGGVLTVSDGTHTAHIDLSGTFPGFVASSDGHGGTIVKAGSPPPPAAESASAHGFASAMAAFGATSAAPGPSGVAATPGAGSATLATPGSTLPSGH